MSFFALKTKQEIHTVRFTHDVWWRFAKKKSCTLFVQWGGVKPGGMALQLSRDITIRDWSSFLCTRGRQNTCIGWKRLQQLNSIEQFWPRFKVVLFDDRSEDYILEEFSPLDETKIRDLSLLVFELELEHLSIRFGKEEAEEYCTVHAWRKPKVQSTSNSDHALNSGLGLSCHSASGPDSWLLQTVILRVMARLLSHLSFHWIFVSILTTLRFYKI